MELVILEGAFVPLSVLEVLRALAVEHAVVPVAFVFAVSALSVQDSPSALNAVSELAFVPAAIAPPESAAAVSLACLELSLVDVALLASPTVNAPSFLLIEPELSEVEVSSCEVELALALELSVVELSLDDLVGALEEANALAVRPVDLGLSYVDNLRIFKELGVVVRGLNSQYRRRAVLDSQQLLQPQLNAPQLPTDEPSLIVQIIQVKLRLLQHLLLRVLIDLQLAAHPADQQPQGLVHLINGLELATFNLLQRVLREQHGLLLSMQFILLGDVALDDSRVALMEICEDLQQLLVRLIDPPDEVGELVLLEVLAEGLEAVLHELGDLDGVVVLVRAVDGEADGADEAAVLAVGVDADEGGVLAVAVAVVRLDELLEALGELLHFHFDRHPTIYNFIYASIKEDPTTQTNIGLALPIESSLFPRDNCRSGCSPLQRLTLLDEISIYNNSN